MTDGKLKYAHKNYPSIGSMRVKRSFLRIERSGKSQYHREETGRKVTGGMMV